MPSLVPQSLLTKGLVAEAGAGMVQTGPSSRDVPASRSGLLITEVVSTHLSGQEPVVVCLHARVLERQRLRLTGVRMSSPELLISLGSD
jgi:hypothetical protein